MLYNRQEITPQNKNGKKPEFTQVGRAHGIIKNTIIDATNTAYYIIVKYLTNLQKTCYKILILQKTCLQ